MSNGETATVTKDSNQSSLEVHECVATNVKKSSSPLISEVSPQSNPPIGFSSFCSSRPNGVLIAEEHVAGYPLKRNRRKSLFQANRGKSRDRIIRNGKPLFFLVVVVLNSTWDLDSSQNLHFLSLMSVLGVGCRSWGGFFQCFFVKDYKRRTRWDCGLVLSTDLGSLNKVSRGRLPSFFSQICYFCGVWFGFLLISVKSCGEGLGC